MFSILVNEKGGESKRLEFDKPEVTIGRVQGNDIILPKGNVSKRHSRIVLKDGKFIIVDLKSTNGTYVNGRKITSPLVVKNTDKVYIGDFILSIEEPGAAAAEPEPKPAAPAPPRPRTPSVASVPPPPPRRVEEDEPLAPPAPPASPMAMDDSEGADAPFGSDASPAEEPPPEPPRRSTQQVPAQSPRPSVAAAPPPAARPEPARPASRADIPAIAPSRPVASPRPVAAPPPAAPAPVAPVRSKPVGAPVAAPPRRPTLSGAVDGADQSRRGRILQSLRQISSRLHAALGEDALRFAPEQLRERAEAQANELVGEIAQESGLPPGIEPDQLLRDAVAEAVGLGPLDELMADESMLTITVGRHDRIHVDRQGQGRALSPRYISSPDALVRIVERVAARSGRLDEFHEARRMGGVFEARLANGFALAAAVGSLAAAGGSMVLRRGRRDAQRLSDLAQQGMLSSGMADFLDLAVRSRRSIMVAGPAGSGRSTLIGALARATEGQRVVMLEEAPELDGGDLPWISISAAGAAARRGFAAALRLKPERLVVSDVRGPEALDVVSALAAGMDGAIIGITAASARDAIARLAAAARMAADAPSLEQVNAEIGAGVQVVAFLGRGAEGEPRVQEIGEISTGADGLVVTAVFSLRGEGVGARFAASGHVPAWAEGAPASMFRA